MPIKLFSMISQRRTDAYIAGLVWSQDHASKHIIHGCNQNSCTKFLTKISCPQNNSWRYSLKVTDFRDNFVFSPRRDFIYRILGPVTFLGRLECVKVDYTSFFSIFRFPNPIRKVSELAHCSTALRRTCFQNKLWY